MQHYISTSVYTIVYSHQEFNFYPLPYSGSPLPIFLSLPATSHLFPSDSPYSVLCIYVLFLFGFQLFCFVLFCFCIPHTREIIWYFYFSVWLLSLNIIHSRSIHIVTLARFNRLSNLPVMYVPHLFNLFIHCALGLSQKTEKQYSSILNVVCWFFLCLRLIK